ncbi:MAG: NADH-quinone oxidoreductase subunit C [Thermodesulfovibrionales bacterium]|nr:NADH-quinone oxidoreductase subunit C [Thermodesulfovibrionales bacterium]
MEPLQIAEKIREKFPDEVLDVKEFREQVAVTLKKDRILEICRYLHDDSDLCFDYLVDLCGVDYFGKKEKRFEVVYHLYSIQRCHAIRLKAAVAESSPEIDSVTAVWAGANWHERECYDMFGIIFKGHPDMRRVLMPEDWEGHPLRKDYPVKGPEKEWLGFGAVLERAKRFKEFDWQE